MDNELEQLKRDFDLFGYMQKCNGGSYRPIHGGYMFDECHLCGHMHDLAFYQETNTFYCFSRGGSTGGSPIDYIMLADGLDTAAAIDRLFELSGKKRSQSRKVSTAAPCNSGLLEKLQKAKPDLTYTIDDIGFGRLFADVFKDVARFNTTANE